MFKTKGGSMKKLFAALSLLFAAVCMGADLGQSINISNYATKLIIPNDYSTVCEPAVGLTSSLSSSYYLCTAGQGHGFGKVAASGTFTKISASLSAPVPSTQSWVEFSWYDKTTSGVGGYCL